MSLGRKLVNYTQIFVKLDIDGSSIRTPVGSSLCGITGFAGIRCNLLPELMAIKHGFHLA